MMKSLLIAIALSILIGASLGWTENPPNMSIDTIKLLSDESTLGDRLRGFRKAASVDSREINELLVQLLDSKADGGKLDDLLLLPSWHESLIILTERFPEAGITKRPIDYKHGDAVAFKNWWSKNQMRIKYHDNTQSLITNPAFDTNQPQPFAPQSPEATKESASAPTPAPKAQTQAENASDPSPKTTATPLATETRPSSSGFPIVPVAIIGTAIVGIVICIVRRKSK